MGQTYDEAIHLLSCQRVEVISLDHDLAGKKTRYDVVCWIERQYRMYGMEPPQVFCHSQNPVGRQRIQTVIERLKIRMEIGS